MIPFVGRSDDGGWFLGVLCEDGSDIHVVMPEHDLNFIFWCMRMDSDDEWNWQA